MGSFTLEGPILRTTRGKIPGARWLLWPVVLWRVVAPVGTRSRWNVFQIGVLRMARAGVSTVDEVASHLALDNELTALVMHELMSRQLVDASGAISEKGLKVLHTEESPDLSTPRVGWAVTEPMTGKLWPALLTGDLPHADLDTDHDGRLVLTTGTVGDPWTDAAFVVRPGRDEPFIASQPSAAGVLSAARRYNRRRDQRDELSALAAQKVSFLDETSTQAWFALRVRTSDGGDWFVDAPLRKGASRELRSLIETRFETQPGLRKWLAPLVGGPVGRETISEIQARAEFEVEERLTLRVRQFEGVRTLLVAMQRALLEAQQPEAPDDKWDDVLVKAQKAAERVVKLVLDPSSGDLERIVASLARSDESYNAKHLDAVAGSLGFEAPLPTGLSRVRRGKVNWAVRQVLEHGDRAAGSLRPLTIVALLSAQMSHSHPLRGAAVRDARLLRKIHELASARDDAGHDGVATDWSSVPVHVETAFNLTEFMLTNPNTGNKSDVETT